MKRNLTCTLLLFLCALLLCGCGRTAPAKPADVSPALEEPAATPAPLPAEAPATPSELPLIEDPSSLPEGSFPGGLDDDGRGPDEYESYGDEYEPTEGAPLESWDAVPLDADGQYRANVFLSNFAEQYFADYGYDDEDHVARAVDFVHRWCKINSRDSIRYETVDGEPWEVIDLDRADEIADRYLSSPLSAWPAEEIRSAERGFFSDNKLYFPAADGEAYNRLAIVYYAETNGDGLYSFYFDIYEVDLDEYFDRGVDSAYYRLGPGDVYEEPSLTYIRSGTATALDGVWQGRAAYKLLYYATYEG